jgi:uncharacterized protein
VAAGLRQKSMPQRTCVGCGTLQAKRQMVRVVRDVSGAVAVDPTGKRSGRGAYLCKRPECWEKAIQRSLLNRALKTEISGDDREALVTHGRLYGIDATTQSAPEAEGDAGS